MKRHCGVCHEITTNKEWCNECESRSARMKKEIEKRKTLKKLNQ